ncbi:MAG: HPF/RaiA family ribosome-associated protein [Anaerolineae bacterium]
MDAAFAIEFQTEIPQLREELFAEADRRLRRLAEGHKDITRARVVVDQPAHAETPFIYEARVVVYVRPGTVVGSEKSDSAIGALKGALDAVERQIRERRGKLARPWEQPS